MTNSQTSRQNANQQETERIKSLLRSQIDRLICDLFGSVAKKSSNGYRIGSLAGEAGTSLAISRMSGKEGLWQDHNPSGSGSGDIIELIKQVKNLDFVQVMEWARNWLGETPNQSHPPKLKQREKVREANQEFMDRRKKRLRDNPDAMKWLHDRGLTDETIQNFNLGLSEPYTNKEGVTQQNALLAPLQNESGIFTSQTAYYNIPGVTANPIDKNGWMKGSPQSYYAEKFKGQTSLLVCEGLKDLWRTHQALGNKLEESGLLLISSTHGSAIPDEWKSADFWSRFENIFLGHDNEPTGDEMASKISQVAGHETMRVCTPRELGKDWTDFWQNGGTVQKFQELLSEATVISAEIAGELEDALLPGRFTYNPVDIATAFHRGNLYYPARTLTNVLETTKNESGKSISQLTTKIETVVVRSDHTIQTVVEDPAPRGTPAEDRVLRLTDGTIIESRPKASSYATWSWGSIQTFCKNPVKGRPLKELLGEIREFLRQTVWLPYDHDYDLLTLLVPVTYAQAIFQSVPMILVVGPFTSGKSALGRAMSRVCANAVTVGQISAAGVARLINETKGFVVLDDLEAIANNTKGNNSQFTELVQALKLSYNKDTSWKIWIDVNRGMKIEKLNFFGVKMINNTSGTDNILGSRMLRVQTRRIPEALKSTLANHDAWDSPRLNLLRDELHTWTFENVDLIDITYKRLFPHPTDRASEISAPLRVFADISEDDDLYKGLEAALETKQEVIEDPDDPIEAMTEAMKRLVREGYRSISPTHVVLEMKTLIDQNSNRASTNEISCWEDPAWVGRQLRSHDIIDMNSPASRQWLFGKSLRVYSIKQHFIDQVLKNNDTSAADSRTKKATDFCKGCADCRYKNSSCSIMDARFKSAKDANIKLAVA